MNTLDAILECYLLDTLSQQSNEDLLLARDKVATYYEVARNNPKLNSDAVPPANVLKDVHQQIEQILSNRSTGLDGMTPLNEVRSFHA